jgi:hypothetical protein
MNADGLNKKIINHEEHEGHEVDCIAVMSFFMPFMNFMVKISSETILVGHEL